MPRPKGSKNKIDAVTEEVVKQDVPHETKEEVCKGNKTKCGHPKSLHYDGLRGSCNSNGCVCDAFY
jgi:hypothetical protein